MTPEAFLALVAIAAIAAFTPGPNNALVANSGATFGMRRTWPHVLGITFGFPVMVFLVGFFLGELFQSSALLREALRWLGAAILLWLAWKIATTGGLAAPGAEPRPFSFFEAAAFQWINPKGWAMAIAITAQFVQPATPMRSAAIIGLVFIAMGLFSATTWAVLGAAITRWVNTDNRLRWFNRSVAAMLASCVLLLFLD